MKRLQESRIDLIKKYLQHHKLDPDLLPEILDHLACEAEEGLWDGKTFEQTYGQMLDTVDAQTLLDLNADRRSLLAMEKSLNDIVFEGRNQSYGAYDLRKSYGQTMGRSVLMGVTLFILIVFFPNLYARLVPDPKPEDIAYIVEARPIDILLEQIPKVQPEPVIPEPAVAKTLRSLPPVVMPDEDVPVETLPPTTGELEKASPGAEDMEGEGIGIIVPPTTFRETAKTAAVEVRVKEELSELFNVEQAPQYKGGTDALNKFLSKNLRYPSNAERAGVQGKVFVQFTVGFDGKIENATVVKGIGFGCDEEAIRVVRQMDDWIPGRQAGNPVRVRFTLPISFQIN